MRGRPSLSTLLLTLTAITSVLYLLQSARAQRTLLRENFLTGRAQTSRSKAAQNMVAVVGGGNDPNWPGSAHASTNVRLDDESGRILVAFFGGESEGADDVAIYTAVVETQRGGGARPRWQKPVALFKVSDEAHWNPVLFRSSADGKFVMHFKVGNSIPQWRTYVSTSVTGLPGAWSKPTELVAGDHGGRGCVRAKPLVASDGTLVCGASTEHGPWRAFFDVSTDGGVTFQRTDDVAVENDDVGLIQPSVWETPDHVLHAFFRSDAGAVYYSSSQDFGRTWLPAQRTKLPNNNSGLDVVRLHASGVLVVAYNPVTSSWRARYPLRLSVSADNGKTWDTHYDIETTPGEYSYPALVAWSDGEGFDLTYTHKRTGVAFASLSLAELRELSTT